MKTEPLEAAAHAANLLASAVQQAHHAACHTDGARLVELALRGPLRRARELEADLAEILAALQP